MIQRIGHYTLVVQCQNADAEAGHLDSLNYFFVLFCSCTAFITSKKNNVKYSANFRTNVLLFKLKLRLLFWKYVYKDYFGDMGERGGRGGGFGHRCITIMITDPCDPVAG